MRKKRKTASSIAKAAVQEVKDSAKDILNTPIVEKAKETGIIPDFDFKKPFSKKKIL